MKRPGLSNEPANAIVLPSGENENRPPLNSADATPVASCLAAPPATGARSSATVSFPSPSTLSRANATCVPSGESCGSESVAPSGLVTRALGVPPAIGTE